MTDIERWHKYAKDFEWTMPSAPAWKRLPIIRHVRAGWTKFKIERWYSSGPGSIGLRSGYDDWVAFGIYYGLERPLSDA